MPNIPPRPEDKAKDFPVLLTAAFLLIAVGISYAIVWGVDYIISGNLTLG